MTQLPPGCPQNWHQGDNVDDITFKQLLTHTSGIYGHAANDVDYEYLKNLIANGVSTNKTPAYQNQNFALFRIIIPYLNGFNEQGVTNRPMALSQAYLSYMNSHVFSPIGIQTVVAKPDPVNPTFFYPFPPENAHGWDFGDATLGCAGSGIHLSMNEVSLFLNKLRFSNLLLNDQQRQLMDNHLLGWDRWSVTQGMVQLKGGYLYFPTENGNAELNTGIYDFSIGVQVSLVINSRYCPDTYQRYCDQCQ